MDNLQVRLPDEDMAALDAIAGQLRTSRSDAARAALEEGLRSLRLRFALEKYAAGDLTLARAAEEAGVSLQRMAVAARDRGIPFFRYAPDDLDHDADRARGALARKPRRRPPA
jgi:predicted HTH domain antitoxin